VKRVTNSAVGSGGLEAERQRADVHLVQSELRSDTQKHRLISALASAFRWSNVQQMIPVNAVLWTCQVCKFTNFTITENQTIVPKLPCTVISLQFYGNISNAKANASSVQTQYQQSSGPACRGEKQGLGRRRVEKRRLY
jgi:hypothetical protein